MSNEREKAWNSKLPLWSVNGFHEYNPSYFSAENHSHELNKLEAQLINIFSLGKLESRIERSERLNSGWSENFPRLLWSNLMGVSTSAWAPVIRIAEERVGGSGIRVAEPSPRPLYRVFPVVLCEISSVSMLAARSTNLVVWEGLQKYQRIITSQ